MFTSFYRHFLAWLTLFVLTSATAAAVTVDQGEIEANATGNTVDIWFWSSDADGVLTMQIDPLSTGDPLTGLEDPQMFLYADDGALDIGDLIATANNTNGLNPQIVELLPAGDYIIAVGASGLGAGQFDPFHTNSDPTQAWTYEIAFSGQPVVAINCVLEGNLDGTFSKSPADSESCHLPSDVPAPASVPLLGIGLGLLAAAWHRGKAA